MKRCLLALLVALSCCLLPTTPARAAAPARIPVILDTDIGDDIDDTWALALVLKSPELDVKMVVSDTGDTVYRAKLIAKLLQVAGRTDVAVGIGLRQKTEFGRQGKWVENYELKSYPGQVHEDGVVALIDLIMNSPEPVTLICIGPVPNIRAALEKEPKIAERARFIGMHGSVRRGYGGKATPDKEWNVVCDPAAAQKTFSAPWPKTITPLDTCGLVHLRGEKYRQVAEAKDPVTRAVIENYHLWLEAGQGKKPEKVDASSTLFDTVAIYLAVSHDLVNMETVPLVVTDDGFTRESPQGQPVDCALSWKDRAAFEDFLVDRLAGQ